jgi:transcriptional regulator with XRE-family HTH domain
VPLLEQFRWVFSLGPDDDVARHVAEFVLEPIMDKPRCLGLPQDPRRSRAAPVTLSEVGCVSVRELSILGPGREGDQAGTPAEKAAVCAVPAATVCVGAAAGELGVVVADEPGDAPTFGGLLRERRIAAGFTQEQLAEQAGLGTRTIRDLERDRVRRPHRESIALLATALGLAPAARDELARAGGQLPVRPEPGAAAAGVLVPRQLPPAVTHFVGRSDVLKALTEVADGAARQCGAVTPPTLMPVSVS